MQENSILRQLKHPFILTMKYSFQDRSNLYLVMPNMMGGDFRFHLIQNWRFSETQTKFFVACVVTALEYIHENNIIHRDIKPENLIFDESGYLYVTDFGIAKHFVPDNAKDTSGTPGYIAPEILAWKNHSFSVDYFALGIIIYECIIGNRPYSGRTRKDFRQQVFSRQAWIKRSDVMSLDWSDEALDFCNSLIQRKTSSRLGENGIAELKQHSWLKDFDWEALLRK